MFDETRAHQFSERLLAGLNHAALSLMTSVGHRTRLFDTMAALGPATCEAIARRAELEERYVREWLGAMVTGRMVELDPQTQRYTLPAEHAAFLTRESTLGNIAAFTQYIAVLGAVEDDVVRCFREGGGVPYERFPRFHEVMAEDSAQTVLASLDDRILPLVEGLSRRLEEGIRVLDVGCGSGRALGHLASRFPKSSFVGLDLSETAVAAARAEAGERGALNLRFVVRDLSTFDEDAEEGAYDFITAFDAIHDQARPRAVLRGIARALAPDGVFLMQDIRGSSRHHGDLDHPVGPFLYTISCMHCMTVSLAQGGEGLGAMWGEERARELLGEAGFTRVEAHRLEHDFQNSFYVVRR